MSSSCNPRGLGLSERCGLWNVEPLPPASQPFLLPDSHLQQGVPLSSRITGTERLIGEVLPLFHISPSPWSSLRLNAGCFPTPTKPPLSLFNKYILLLCQVPKIYTCQFFRLWVKQCVIQIKKPRLRNCSSERVCDFLGSQNVCAVVPRLKLPSPESWAQASSCCRFLWQEQSDPVRTPVCFPWGLVGKNLAASWGHQLCWWHSSLCIRKYMDQFPGRIQMAHLKRFW